MSQVLDIDNLLAELTQEGELQSSGRFTLDLNKAKEKLAQFQLANPYCYVLKLVQAAVAGGATHFALRSGSTEVKVNMRGLSFSALQLENVLYCLLGEDAPIPVTPALRHLAVAINASVGTRASRLSVKSWDGEQGVEVYWGPGGNGSRPWLPEAAERYPLTCFEMNRAAGDVGKELYAKLAKRDVIGMISGDRKGMDNEQALLHDHCNFAPIPILINGNACPGYELGAPAEPVLSLTWLWGKMRGDGPSYFPAHHLFEVYLSHQPADRGIAAPRRSYSRGTVGLDPNGLYRAILAQPAALKGPIKVVPILDGVMLNVTRFHWSDLGAIFHIDAESLTLDLTGMSVVHDEKTQACLLDLARQHCQVGETFVQSPQAPGHGKVRSRLVQVLTEAKEALP